MDFENAKNDVKVKIELIKKVMDFEVNTLTNLENAKKDIKVNIELINETIQYVKEKMEKEDVNLTHFIFNYMQLLDLQLDETRYKLKSIMDMFKEFDDMTKTLLKCKQQHNDLVLKLKN